MISIVTGTLNRRGLLPDLIADTVNRDSRLELILVDGGSNDGTIEYLKQLNHPAIKLIEIGHRSPYAHYMNIGIDKASYEYICQWNDDALLTNSWQEVIDELSNNYDAYIFSWAICSYEDFKNSNIIKRWWLKWDGKPLGQFSCCMSYGIYKKKIFREIGMYDPAFLYYTADADMLERARHFEYSIKLCPNIKVLALPVEKRAYGDIFNFSVMDKNLSEYTRKKIPCEIPILRQNLNG